MSDFKEVFSQKKIAMDELEVPAELEMRLHRALQTSSAPRPRKHWQIKIALLLLALFLIGYQYDTLAYYGSKIIGYDQVMTGNLQELNQLGKGQTIGKSYTFKNGVSITLDGVMLDDNQLLAFYTVKNPPGKIDEFGPTVYLRDKKGMYAMGSAHGIINNDNTEVKYTRSFEIPHDLDKKLTLNVSLSDQTKTEDGEIAFTLDRHKAMGHSLKKHLHHTVKVGNRQIRFDSIVASPTTTVVKGSIQRVWELGWDQITGQRLRPVNLNMELMVNGKVFDKQGSGLTTDQHGITFSTKFESLPSDLKQLQIKLLSFEADHDVDQQIELHPGELQQSVPILGQNIHINKVCQSQGDTYVTFSTAESVVLSRVFLLIDGKRTRLQETILDENIKQGDGTIIHTRTMHFPGTGNQLQLDIKRMTYAQPCNHIINIPLK